MAKSHSLIQVLIPISCVFQLNNLEFTVLGDDGSILSAEYPQKKSYQQNGKEQGGSEQKHDRLANASTIMQPENPLPLQTLSGHISESSIPWVQCRSERE